MKFLLENNLKKTGKWLRFLGYEVVILTSAMDSNTIEKYRDHIFITTSKKWDPVFSQIKIRSLTVSRESWEEQLAIIMSTFSLPTELKLTICPECGSELEHINKEEIQDRIPYRTYENIETVTHCKSCEKIFWIGSHIERMKKHLQRIQKNKL